MNIPIDSSRVFAFAGQQLKHLVESSPDQFPIYTENGRWKIGGESWTNWCEGFLGGQLWIMHQVTGDTYWREKAEHYSRLIEPRKTDRNVHDLGFLFWSTWKRWYDLTGDPIIQRTVIQAGQTLALRYQENGQYLSSFLGSTSLFIDIMMNVGTIFYAAKQTSDAALYEKALRHCLTTRKYLVRGDGSTAHEGIFDPNTGQFLRQSTQQGWRSDSSWARGTAWAIYGYSTVYEMTGDTRFLQTAELCADFYIQHTPSHGVPPNDWNEPGTGLLYESSAAAVTASGMLTLSRQCGDWARVRLYRSYALRILETLCSHDFLADETANWEGILKHGIYHRGKGLGVDESVMWGDYFFLEALSKIAHGH